ncbi:MAG TPA: fructosamine kinase family protein [Woeseiaceae bacterium]|nr:fructosamine kinase family protein [Woeseiaceae bacterium]
MARRVFRKTGPLSDLARFEAEAEGLNELAAAEALRVPEVYGVGTDAGGAYIEMERLDLAAPDPDGERRFGAQLAALHRVTADAFGWHRDNWIGGSPQPNPRSLDWPAFFREHRLEFQLALAAKQGYRGELETLGRALASGLDALFGSYRPVPSLLHGDLWAGNWGMAHGHPVVFDPAVYYGDRETDLAMTRLFGGFGRAFYAAYEETWPLAAGWERRVALYQLYHVLNHLNLFGGAYHGQALMLLRELTDQQ